MNDTLTRFRQRFANFTKSLSHLRSVKTKATLSDIEKAGLVQFFEASFELSWKVMKDFLTAEGYDVKSPRDTIKTAFDYGLIDDGALWLEALEKRNLAPHTYDDTILDELQELILSTYFPMMEKLKEALEQKL